jgi:hypothetical protein
MMVLILLGVVSILYGIAELAFRDKLSPGGTGGLGRRGSAACFWFSPIAGLD